MDKSKKIVWTGTFMDYGGYAYMNRNYVSRLEDRGWDLNIEAIRSPKEIDDMEYQKFSSMGAGPDARCMISQPGTLIPPENCIKVIAHLPLERVPKPPGGKRVIYTMMESRQVNQHFILNRCNKFYEECWTPTEYNAKIFREAGLDIPCKVAPIGIDDIYVKDNAIDGINFCYKTFGNNPPPNPEGFTFLSVFRWSFRKGFDILIKAYLQEFKKSDNVSLVIMSRHACMDGHPRFKEAVERDLRGLVDAHGTPDSAPIYWCGDIIPSDLMPTMYNLGDAFVSTSRGEGFCLPLLEAAKMSLPVIAPYHTGFTDYLCDDVAEVFDVDEWIPCQSVPEWNRGWVTPEFVGQSFPKFGAKAVEQVQSLMRKISENHEEGKRKNTNFKKLIDEKYSWDSCVEKVESYLEEL